MEERILPECEHSATCLNIGNVVVPLSSRLRFCSSSCQSSRPLFRSSPVCASLLQYVLVCEWICIRSAAPTGRGKGRTNSRAREQLSNTLLPRFLPLFFPRPCLPGCQSRAALEAADRLRELPESHRTHRGPGAFPLKDFKKKKTPSASPHTCCLWESLWNWEEEAALA